jgi:hypothetical protein
MVHCERCGAEAAPVGGAFDHCVACGLFVCHACWHLSGFCIACSPAMAEPSAARDLALLRRVDRRLREAEREASSIRRALATGERLEALTADVACLELKVASASRARDEVLGGRISARRRRRLEPLTHRIDRHAVSSQTAAARAASALTLAKPSAIRSARTIGWFPRRRAVVPSLRWAIAAVAVLFVGVLLADLASRAGRPAGEGTLSGVPSRAPGASASIGVGGSPGLGTSPSPTSAPLALEASFDDLRIGPISDGAWVGAPAEARVVAFPTPFDRSVEVRSTNGNALETCLSPGPGDFAVESLSVDLRLDDRAGTVATTSLRSRSPAHGAEVVVTTDAAIVSVAGTPIGSSGGIAPGAWFRLGVAVTERNFQVRVTPIDGGPSVEIPVASAEMPLAHAICFGVLGEPGASVHYDNVAVVYQRSSER